MPVISRSMFQRPSYTKFSNTISFLQRQQPRHQQLEQLLLQQRHYNSKAPIRPYSDSLPSPGYEWCSRCEIRTHRFQKPMDCHNSCLDRPQLFGLGMCAPARQYYQQQVLQMIFLSIFCFAAAPLVNATTHTQEDDHPCFHHDDQSRNECQNNHRRRT